jgi:DDT domain/PHD-finger/WSTF, HB1, Itc1p, MBD9 motif 1
VPGGGIVRVSRGGGGGGARPRGSCRGVRVNDEFHSMNNGLSSFPDEQRSQAGVGPRPVPVHVPAWGLTMQLPSDALALALQVYAVLRGFSWQIRLAPFSFSALLAAVVADDSSTLRDEVHICLLRALAWHDSKLQRQARKLDFARLDATSWPDYLWEYLRFFHCFDWWRSHVITRPPERPLVDPDTGVSREAAAAAAVAKAAEKAALPPGPMPATGGEGAADGAWRAYVRRLNKLDTTPEEMMMRSYADLSVTERFALLNLLCDVLLEQPHVRDEIERRMLVGEWHAGAGGEGGAGAMMTAEQLAAGKAAEAAGAPVEHEVAGCVLCTQIDAALVRCDACDAPYHMRCLGYRVLPGGAWLCPECALGGRGECAGVRVPMAAMQAGRITLYLLHGNVLRMPHPGQKIVPEDEDMVDCGLEWLQGDAAMAALAAAKRKSGQDGAHASAADMLADVCSTAAVGGPAEGEEGYRPERVPPPECTPWSYCNTYGCARLLDQPLSVLLSTVVTVCAPTASAVGCREHDSWPQLRAGLADALACATTMVVISMLANGCALCAGSVGACRAAPVTVHRQREAWSWSTADAELFAPAQNTAYSVSFGRVRIGQHAAPQARADIRPANVDARSAG